MEKSDVQAVWNDRNEQVSFAMHINDLIAKKFGRITSSKYQGGGKVASLLITGHDVNPKKMDEIRKFLIQKYGLKLHCIKGHIHIVGTIVVHICEISEASRKRVEDDFKKIIINPIASKQAAGKTTRKQQTVVSATEKATAIIPQVIEESEPVVVNESKTETKNISIMEKFSIIKKGRLLISFFLTTIFKFEGLIASGKKDKIFSFNEEKDDDLQIISFRNEAETEIAHKAIAWYYGYGALPNEGIGKEGNDVWMNFFALDVIKKRPIYINFTLPPLKGESKEQISKRINHVLTGYKTSKLEIINEDSFEIAYSRVVTTIKFFELIVEMGWNAKFTDDSIICQFRQEVKTETDEPSSVITEVNSISSQNESIQPVNEQVTSSPADQSSRLSSYIFPGLPMSFLKKLKTREELYLEVEKVYNNQPFFSKLKEENQQQIIEVIEQGYAEAHPNEYVEMLLKLLK